MFIRYFTELSLPRAVVEQVLLQASEELLPGLLEAACDRAGELLEEVGAAAASDREPGRPEVEIGTARRGAARTSLPIARRAAGGSIPDITADLGIAALGSSRTQLSLSALCQPPPGAPQETADRLFLQRVMETAVKDFLDGAKEAIEQRAGPRSPTALGRRT